MPIQPIPNEHQPLSPYLVVRGAARAIEFYVQAFGARELYRLVDPGDKNRLGHAELEVGGGLFMLADEYPDFGALSPVSVGGTPVTLHLYVADVDLLVERAERAGATILRPLRDEFFGDRVALLQDPFGHQWRVASRKEEVSPAEMQRRWDTSFA